MKSQQSFLLIFMRPIKPMSIDPLVKHEENFQHEHVVELHCCGVFMNESTTDLKTWKNNNLYY